MAFKMRGFPKQTGVGGVKAEEDLASELKGSTKKIDYDEAEDTVNDIKEKANNADRPLTAKEKQEINWLENPNNWL